MRKVRNGSFETGEIVMGCMRIAGMSVRDADALVNTAFDGGITLFDHADIYGKGESEALFGKVLENNPGLREKIYIQTKCGIRPDMYDFSYEHIMSAVEGSLERLGIEKIDTLLFHRPDALAERDEFARALEDLKKSGKVGQFGVSNMAPEQIKLLESWSGEKMVADQLQLSLMHAGMLVSGMNVNVEEREGEMHDGAILPYCQRKGIALQAWSPFQYGMFKGCFIDNEKFPALNKKLSELAVVYDVPVSAVALAWILRIPGDTQAVLGTTSIAHMKEALEAESFTLERKEWYELYLAAGYPLP